MENDRFTRIKEQLRTEVHTAINIWTELLTDLGAEYAYAKGSATKQWDSPVDYVPQLSDLDIHANIKNGFDSLELEPTLDLLKSYETRFTNELPGANHLPRIQLVDIHKLYTDPDMVYPRSDQIKVMIGDPHLDRTPSTERIKEIDRKNILELQSVIDTIPEMLIDRTGMERWIALRRLCWRVSPTPIRILSQYHEDPIDLWGWNRTEVISALYEFNLDKLAKLYEQYYMYGWKLFETDFENTDIYHEMFRKAYAIFQSALSQIKT